MLNVLCLVYSLSYSNFYIICGQTFFSLVVIFNFLKCLFFFKYIISFTRFYSLTCNLCVYFSGCRFNLAYNWSNHLRSPADNFCGRCSMLGV